MKRSGCETHYVLVSDSTSWSEIRERGTELYILGGLSSAETEEFERHLPNCPECIDELAIFDALKHNMRALTLEQELPVSTHSERDELARYHDLVDRKLTHRLTRAETTEFRTLRKKLDSQEDPQLIRELESSLHRDRELLRQSINEILTFARQLKAK